MHRNRKWFEQNIRKNVPTIRAKSNVWGHDRGSGLPLTGCVQEANGFTCQGHCIDYLRMGYELAYNNAKFLSDSEIPWLTESKLNKWDVREVRGPWDEKWGNTTDKFYFLWTFYKVKLPSEQLNQKTQDLLGTAEYLTVSYRVAPRMRTKGHLDP